MILSKARFKRRIFVASNAIDTKDNEVTCFIIFCFNCIRYDENATFKTGLTSLFHNTSISGRNEIRVITHRNWPFIKALKCYRVGNSNFVFYYLIDTVLQFLTKLLSSFIPGSVFVKPTTEHNLCKPLNEPMCSWTMPHKYDKINTEEHFTNENPLR